MTANDKSKGRWEYLPDPANPLKVRAPHWVDNNPANETPKVHHWKDKILKQEIRLLITSFSQKISSMFRQRKNTYTNL